MLHYIVSSHHNVRSLAIRSCTHNTWCVVQYNTAGPDLMLINILHAVLAVNYNIHGNYNIYKKAWIKLCKG